MLTEKELADIERRAKSDAGAQGDHEAFHDEVVRLVAEVRALQTFGSSYRSGPLQETKHSGLFDDLGSFTLRLYWKHDENGECWWVDFELYEVLTFDAKKREREYQRRDSNHSPDPVLSLDEAEMTAQGFVKWDGCTQFNVNSVHVDSRSGLDALFAGIAWARECCAKAMGDTYDRQSEYAP